VPGEVWESQDTGPEEYDFVLPPDFPQWQDGKHGQIIIGEEESLDLP